MVGAYSPGVDLHRRELRPRIERRPEGHGLVMLILIGILPGLYAINPHVSQAAYMQLLTTSRSAAPILDAKSASLPMDQKKAESLLSDYLKSGAVPDAATFTALAYANRQIVALLSTSSNVHHLSSDQRKQLRSTLYLVAGAIGKAVGAGLFPDPAQRSLLSGYRTQLDAMTKF